LRPFAQMGYAAKRKRSRSGTLLASCSLASQFDCADRAKEMIKSNAWSIAPAELEALLLEHPAVRDAAVIGWPDAETGEAPRAFVVLRAGETATPEQLIAFANGKVAKYKAIRRLEIVESIPKTASGKILRRELKDAALQRE
jgi:long-chain acyl-CoA synthetase